MKVFNYSDIQRERNKENGSKDRSSYPSSKIFSFSLLKATLVITSNMQYVVSNRWYLCMFETRCFLTESSMAERTAPLDILFYCDGKIENPAWIGWANLLLCFLNEQDATWRTRLNSCIQSPISATEMFLCPCTHCPFHASRSIELQPVMVSWRI